MKKHLILLILTFVCSITVASSAYAASKWEGTSTNLKGDFRYGKVSFTLEGKTIKNFIVEGVTTSGCGNYKSVVVPKMKVKGNKFSAYYTPIPGINDVIIVTGTIKGNSASGTFSEGPLCSNSGKFKAKKK